MKIHFLLLALVAFVALSQHNVDARLHDPARRRMTERNLLDELLQRRMEALEEMEGEQDSLQDGFVESRRLREGSICDDRWKDQICPKIGGVEWKFICVNNRCQKTCDARCERSCKGKCNWAKCTNCDRCICDDRFVKCMRGCVA